MSCNRIRRSLLHHRTRGLAGPAFQRLGGRCWHTQGNYLGATESFSCDSTTLNIGQGSGYRGFSAAPAVGEIKPTHVESSGQLIYRLYVLADDRLLVEFGDAGGEQVGAVTTITFYSETWSPGIDCNWNGTAYVSAPNAGMYDAFGDNIGENICVVVDGTSSLGPEHIVNGTFDTDIVGWGNNGSSIAWNATNQSLNMTANNTIGRVQQTMGAIMEAGKTYRIQYEVKSISGNGVGGHRVFIAGPQQYLTTHFDTGMFVEEWIPPSNSSGSFDFRIYGNTWDAIGDVVEFDNISVKEVL